MSKLDRYIDVGAKRLRCGYTTGTCAAAAARGAAERLLTGEVLPAVQIATPAGIGVVADLECASCGDGWAEFAVRKDGGDDYDVTDGTLVFARVSLRDEPGVAIDGGEGVGRVTRPGLDQPVGAAAINRVPRQMIAEQLQQAAATHGYAGGFSVVVSIPEGRDLAAHTFNPRLGIEGGISVLGTSGIVRPMSEEAMIASIQLEIRMLAAAGEGRIVIVPGNYGRDYATEVLGQDDAHIVQCSNYIGAALDAVAQHGFANVLVVGHLGKMVKVAAGIMNTHSRVADARAETMAAHAAASGASQDVVSRIMAAATTDECLDILDGAGLREAVAASLVQAAYAQVQRRVGEACPACVVVFSKAYGELGRAGDGAPFGLAG